MKGLHFAGRVELPGFVLDIEFSAAAGQTTALLGPNGAGKSTTLNVVAGLQRLSAGSITLQGQVLDDPQTGTWIRPQQRRLGVAFQDGLLFEHLSVLDNVAFGLVERGTKRAAARQQALELLSNVGLDAELVRRSPRALSGGQAQRAVFARALAGEPQMLLLDEPFGALDVTAHSALRRQLSKTLETSSIPRLLITHDPTDAFLLADVIFIVEQGRITQVGTPAEVRRHPATSYAAGLAGINLLSGHAKNGKIEVSSTTGEFATSATGASGQQVLQVADTKTAGAVLLTIQPRAIALHRSRPSGSPRNIWSSVVVATETLGDITRVVLEEPLPLNVDITTAAAHELGVTVGQLVWAAVKATEIELVELT